MTIEILNRMADSWAQFMLAGLTDASVLLVFLSFLWLFLRRRFSAQFGVCLFLLVLVRVVLPLQLTLPQWCDFVPPRYTVADMLWSPETDLRVTPQPPMTTDGGITVEWDERQDPTPFDSVAVSPSPPRLSLAARLMITWATVVVGLLAWTLVNQRRLWRVLRRTTEIEPEKFAFDLEELRTLVGLRQQVSVTASHEIVSPAVAGLWRPRVLLPASFSDVFSPDQLRWIMLHELAHIRRYDLWQAAFQKAVQIVHFFNPAVWLANWIINRQREFACDDMALAAANVPRRDCAAAFLSIVEQASQPQMIGPLPLGFLRSRDPYRRRLMRILDTDRPLRPRLTLASMLLLATIASLVVPQLRPPAWAQSEETLDEKNVQDDQDVVSLGQSDAAGTRSPGAEETTRQGEGRTGAESQPDNLKSRVQSLEDEVRKLREVLQVLNSRLSASDVTRPRTARLFAAVKRMDLAIKNRQGEVVISPIPNLSSFGSDTTITRLRANGTRVQKGDVIAELTCRSLRDQFSIASITREKANAEMLQTSARYGGLLSLHEATHAEDRLQVDLATLELQKYTDGIFPLELKKLEAKVVEASEALVVAHSLAQGDRPSRGGVNKAERALSIAQSDLGNLRKFERTLQVTRLKGALSRAVTKLTRTVQNNTARTTEVEAIKNAAAVALAVADAKLKSMQAAIDQCTLLAPVAGIVRHSSNIKQGAMVRERQPIVSIMPASAEPEQVLRNVLVIPVGAVRKGGDRVSCFVETTQGIEQRTVQLGQSDSSFVQVIDGLKEGEKVLLGPVSLDDQPGQTQRRPRVR